MTIEVIIGEVNNKVKRSVNPITREERKDKILLRASTEYLIWRVRSDSNLFGGRRCCRSYGKKRDFCIRRTLMSVPICAARCRPNQLVKSLIAPV